MNFFVWVEDFYSSKKYIEKYFKTNILCEIASQKVFVLDLDETKLKFLTSFPFVKWIKKNEMATILLKKSRNFLRIDDFHKMGNLGQGVVVAIIDTGCHPHLDFLLGRNKIVCFKDFLSEKTFPYDDNGHGTFVAGIVGGSGISKCGKFRGVAPACDLVILKALDKNGETQSYNILKAMQWILDNKEKFHIKVVCMSFGSESQGEKDPLMLGAEELWKNGIVVVCAAGNDGPNPNTIKSPGTSPSVITVGSLEKIGEKHFLRPAKFSSRGPSFDFFKPDIVAPGVEIVSTTNSKKFYTKMSGTSVSTPFVAGVCALVLAKHKLSPNELKFFLQKSATKTGFSPNETGSGALNLLALENILKEF